MLNQRVALSKEALFQEVGGEGVILDLHSATYFGLDGVGVRAWQLLQQNPSLAAAHAQLVEEYEVEPAQLEGDLLKLVDQLREAGLATIE
jgi:hypothetical protein